VRRHTLSRAAAVFFPAALLVTFAAHAQEGFEVRELVSPEEEAARELERRKQAPPALAVEPSSLTVTLEAGGSAARTVTVGNAGGQALAWAARGDAAWVEVAPRAGRLGFEEKSGVTLRVSARGLAPGTHRGTVTFDGGGIAGTPASVAVTLRVTRPQAEPPPAGPPRKEEPARPPRRPGPVEPRIPRDGAARGLGLRLGAALPASGDAAEYDANTVLGISYRAGVLEAGLDFGAPEEGSGYTSTPLNARLDAVLGKGAGYFLAGGAFALEFVDDDRDGTSHTNGAFAFDLGAGYSFAGGRADMRAVYQALLGSENVPGRAAVTVGYRF
jgi:hypothetical protein